MSTELNENQTDTPIDTIYTSIFLGQVKWQNLTRASLTNKIVYGSFLMEGILMILGNALLILVITAYKPLRRKEMYIMAGLAMGDLLYGRYNPAQR